MKVIVFQLEHTYNPDFVESNIPKLPCLCEVRYKDDDPSCVILNGYEYHFCIQEGDYVVVDESKYYLWWERNDGRRIIRSYDHYGVYTNEFSSIVNNGNPVFYGRKGQTDAWQPLTKDVHFICGPDKPHLEDVKRKPKASTEEKLEAVKREAKKWKTKYLNADGSEIEDLKGQLRQYKIAYEGAIKTRRELRELYWDKLKEIRNLRRKNELKEDETERLKSAIHELTDDKEILRGQLLKADDKLKKVEEDRLGWQERCQNLIKRSSDGEKSEELAKWKDKYAQLSEELEAYREYHYHVGEDVNKDKVIVSDLNKALESILAWRKSLDYDAFEVDFELCIQNVERYDCKNNEYVLFAVVKTSTGGRYRQAVVLGEKEG